MDKPKKVAPIVYNWNNIKQNDIEIIKNFNEHEILKQGINVITQEEELEKLNYAIIITYIKNFRKEFHKKQITKIITNLNIDEELPQLQFFNYHFPFSRNNYKNIIITKSSNLTTIGNPYSNMEVNIDGKIGEKIIKNYFENLKDKEISIHYYLAN
jgi:hypothetical protein